MSEYRTKTPVEVAVTLERETEKAFLVNEGYKSVWVPKSQVTLNFGKNGVVESITLPEWLAYDKGLI